MIRAPASYLLAGLLLFLAVFAASCSRDSAGPVPQLAVLRFENLSADPSLDWMGRGFSEILSGALDGSPQLYAIQWRSLHAFDAPLGRRPVSVPGVSAERAEALAAGANTIVYGTFSVRHGQLTAHATEEDLTTRKVRDLTASAPLTGGIFPAADELARQLGATHPFGTANPQALREYVDALETTDPTAALRGFAQAAADDSGFGSAYLHWLDAAVEQRNPAEAQRALAQAHAQSGRFRLLDRARLNFSVATLRGDFEARLRAVQELTRQDPQDPNLHRAFGEALLSTRQYEAAVKEFRHALSLRPEDVLSLNSMGYAAAYGGDLPTAIRVLRGYEELRPNEPNPLDSLGDVHYALGHYAEAEQFYLAAARKAPAFLNGGEPLKAAQARLMTGDVAGANEIFRQYLDERERAHDPLAADHAATWLWQTGRRRDAIRRLDQATADPARAKLQAALWRLELGDAAGAAAQARDAASQASPANAAIAGLVLSLTVPDAPGTLPEPLRTYAAAYAGLFHKDFSAAQKAFESLMRRPTVEPDDGLAVLLAWCYQKTGEWPSAEPLLRLNPLPQASGLPLFGSLYFPRLFLLRGAQLDHDGQHGQAVPNYDFFRKLAGPDADIWVNP